jgi:hypothetical protein
MENRVYERLVEGECIQTTVLAHLPSGRFAFKTSLFGTKPYELNMNIPFFQTEKKAYDWIEHTEKWTLRK